MKSVRIPAGLVFIVLLIPGTAWVQMTVNNQTEKEIIMSDAEKNKEIVRNLYEQSLNNRNFELLRNYVSEEYIGPGGKKGAEAFIEQVTLIIDAFPDVQWKIQEIIGEAGKVMIRWKLEGTHTGKPFMNIAPTDKPVSNNGIGIYELEDEKIVNAQIQTDRFGFLQQLGVLPPDFISSLDENVRRDRVVFIDKFLLPQKAEEEFITRMNVNRDFIEDLPGFIQDNVYEQTGGDGNRVIITVAVWENEEALNRAKEAVQAEYQRTGFNPQEFMERLNIKLERGTYRELLY